MELYQRVLAPAGVFGREVMPRYDYVCAAGHTDERTVPIAERDNLKHCRECGLLMVRQPAAPGFIITGYNAANGYAK